MEGSLATLSACMLKLSHEKIVFIIFHPTDKNRMITEDVQFHVGERTVCVTESVKNLVVYFDSS